jgi:hypothetical protein
MQQLGIIMKTLRMGPLVWNILKNVHKPSQITHLNTSGEQWLKHVQTKSYSRQRRAQIDTKK